MSARYSEFDHYIVDVARELDDITRETAAALAEAEGGSAIEHAMEQALRDVADWCGAAQCDFHSGYTLKEVRALIAEGKLPLCHFAIFDQVQVGRYRTDFLLVFAGQGGGHCYVAVECDGHDFHERTKQQAEHDRRRDRDIQGMGLSVLRFTGSEIWRSPTRTAWDCLVQAVRISVSNERRVA